MPPTNPQQMLQTGLAHHRAGRLREAEEAYAQLLRHDPSNPDVLHLAGVVAHQTGRQDAAIETIRRAISLTRLPNARAPMQFNLGNALHVSGRREEAVQAYRAALEATPAFPEALANLAVVLNELGRHEDSAASARSALALRSNFAVARAALGNALGQLGRVEEAITETLAALRVQPALPDALNTLANCYLVQGQTDLAIDAYRRAIAVKPDYVAALNNLGGLLRRENRADEALAAFETVARLRPHLPDAQLNHGVALNDVGRLDDALAAFDRAVARRPDLADAHFSRGLVLEKLARLDKAEDALAESLRLDPGHAGACGLLGVVKLRQGLQHDEAERLMRASLVLEPNRQLHDNLCLLSLYQPRAGGAASLDVHREWAARHAPATPEVRAPSLTAKRQAGPLRVGYVSPDFRRHASAHFIAPLLRGHDRARVRVVCYSNVQRPDEITAQFRALVFDGWREIFGQSDDDVAQLIRADGIDVLVDLAGHTEHNRLLLFGRRLAPVQVSMIGYPGTTGLGTIDFKISDPHADPVGDSDRFYSERLYRLPETFWCFDPLAEPFDPGPPPARVDGCITFGSANSVSKLSAETVHCWARIVSAVPGSRMRMQHSGLASDRTRARIRAIFVEHGVAEDRVLMTGWTSFAEYSALLRSFDIALDTFPFNGGTTTCQQFHAGVPCISLAGDRQVSRMGVSMLRAVGLSDLVAGSIEDYIATAVSLAGDLHRLGEIRASLPDRMRASSLGDARRFTEQLEAAYADMCRMSAGGA